MPPHPQLIYNSWLYFFIPAGLVSSLFPLSDKLTGVLLHPELQACAQNTSKQSKYGRENHRIANLENFLYKNTIDAYEMEVALPSLWVF